ncbi:S8 family serine peptidase [Massilia sp. R2A-15]|uniref:S8 family serine peptidase n=1 Tax=Massilia sp. R2A-15 TaxID=3064278 RepID=UPI0027367AB9|nr:S8 family serine peptidase [Massilia sp. R2A-15]WLI91611.1 S8 family serine peptidase [Massilia sp. R2A-15]
MKRFPLIPGSVSTCTGLRPLALALGAALAAMIGSAGAADFTDGVNQYARGRILVEARAGLAGDDLEKILKVHGGKRRKIGQSNLHVVELPAGVSEVDVVEQLRRNPALRHVELDRRVRSTMAVTDPYIGSEWHIPKIGASTAWDITQGAGVTIAILDSGVDGAHPDLAPNLVAGYNMYSNNTDTSDVCGHGTAVAGSAAARTNNGAGVAGVAGQAKIMPIRVAYFDSASGGCYAYTSTIADGITWAADHGARIANVSYGPLAGSATIQSAANYMKSKGGLVFVSAGNNGVDENITPTTSLIAISATDANDNKASWSSYGSFVSLAAPGENIWTTSKGGIYQGWNGTSFASPVAAGVAALMMAANPALDGAKIEQALYSTAVDLGPAGRDANFGYGRVNAAAAVNAVRTAPPPPADTQAPTSAITSPAASSTVSGIVTVNVAASDNVGVDHVELKANGTVVGTDSASPFSFSWNSANVANGMNTLVATAFDKAGNATASAPVAVNVANTTTPPAKDTTPPVVKIDNPTAGTVSGTVSVNVSASDNSGAAGISESLYIDNALVATGKGGALAYSWRTSRAATGAHTIKAVAKDAAGNTSSVSVTVNVTR